MNSTDLLNLLDACVSHTQMIFRTNHEGSVVRLGPLIVDWFKLEVAKENGHYGFNLQQTELLTHALVHSAAEP